MSAFVQASAIGIAIIFFSMPVSQAQMVGPVYVPAPGAVSTAEYTVRDYNWLTKARVAITSFVDPKSLDSSFVGQGVPLAEVTASEEARNWFAESSASGYVHVGVKTKDKFVSVAVDSGTCEEKDVQCLADFLKNTDNEGFEFWVMSEGKIPSIPGLDRREVFLNTK